eukprot:3249880-Amphidinium_carterae.1
MLRHVAPTDYLQQNSQFVKEGLMTIASWPADVVHVRACVRACVFFGKLLSTGKHSSLAGK